MRKKLKIGLIADYITEKCLSKEEHCISLTPLNFRILLKVHQFDFIFCESAWLGSFGLWKYKIASYPNFKDRNNNSLVELLKEAKKRKIPTIFWNKEDGVHFDRFIDSAMHFDHIFTVDSNCIKKYTSRANFKSISTLMFPVQPKIHSFDGFDFSSPRANFCGSYNSNIHANRKVMQDWLFSTVSDLAGLDIFDRNSNRKNLSYRFPKLKDSKIFRKAKYEKTADIFKSYYASLNVNTIVDSPSMYSRRLVEILACGGIAVTTPALSIEKHFKDFCHVVSCSDEAKDLFERLKYGPSKNDLERAKAGAEYVKENHTWKHRINFIEDILCIN